MFVEEYENPDGTRTQRQSTQPLNVKDQAGNWHPVDPTLETDAGSKRVKAKRHPLNASFAPAADDPALVSVEVDGAKVSLGLDKPEKGRKAKVEGTSAEYSSVAPDTDLKYEVTAGAVKETIVLKKAPAPGKASWRFVLKTDDLTPKLTDDGAVELVDGKGTVKVVMPPIETWDSSGKEDKPNAQTGGTYRLEQVKDGWALTVSVNEKWLRAPERVYPVSVDPTFSYGVVDSWAYRSNGYECQNCGLRIGNSQAAGDTYNRTAFKFDYTPLFGKTVVGTRIDLTRANGGGFTKAWPSNLHHATSLDINGVGPHLASTVVGDVGKFADQRLTAFLKGLVDARDGRAYFMITGAEVPGEYTYKSLNATLYVDTGSAPPAPTPAGPADGSVLTTLTPTLAVNPVTDGDGDAVSYCFTVATGSDGKSGTLVDSGCVSTPTWTVPAGVLSDGVAYTWKATTYSGYSPTVGPWIGHFKVDQRIGAHGPSPVDSAGPVTVNLANGNVSVAESTPSFITVGGTAGLTLTYNSQQPENKGVKASYFDDVSHAGLINDAQQPVLVRNEPQINADWGEASPFAPALGGDWWLARWEGWFVPPVTGTYQFGGVHDDGPVIWINGQKVYDVAGPSNVNWANATGVALTAGQAVPIKVELQEMTGAARMVLYTRTTTGTVPEQIVPADWLTSTDAPALPKGWTLSADLDGTGGTYTEAKVTDQTIVLTDATGAKHTWTKKSTGGYTPPTGEDGVLGVDTAGKVTLYDGGAVYTFRPDGKLDTQTSAVDSRKPAALQNVYNGSPARLTQIKDPVSGRGHQLYYNRPGEDCYGGVTPPSGADPLPPTQMLCRIRYWDGTETRLWYAQGRLTRFEDPGSEISDYGYDAAGLLNSHRSRLVNDWIAADPVSRSGLTDVRSEIVYDTSTGKPKATKVTESAPHPGQLRPTTSYRYDPANRQTFTDIAGANPAVGFGNKVTYDTADRTTSTTDSAGRTSSQEWSPKDLSLSTTDPAGRKTTTVYDHADRPVDSYGPAPASCFAGQLPSGNCPRGMAHGHNAYDEGINGLAVAYYDNVDLSGAPKVHGTGVGEPSGKLVVSYSATTPPVAGLPSASFSTRISGEIQFPDAGAHTIKTWVDDGVRVWIDDQLVVDGWADGGTRAISGTYNNDTAGSIKRIRIDYYNKVDVGLLHLNWIRPGQAEENVPGQYLRPRYGLKTSTTASESDGVADKVGTTKFGENGLDPVYGLATSGRAGGTIGASVSYEAPGSGYLRKTAKTMPTGARATYTYYGDTENRANPCVPGSAAVNQGGMVKLSASTTPASGPTRVDEQVYDLSGRIVAERTNGDWTCNTFDSRDRPVEEKVPASADAPARTVRHDYAVGGDPLTTSVSDDKGVITTTTDLLGRVVSYTDVNGTRTNTAYDPVGRITTSTVTPPNAADSPRTLSFTYDDAGRTLTQRLDNTTLASVTYDNAGELATATYGNGSSLASVTKDNGARLLNLGWKTSDGRDIVSSVGRTSAGTIIDESLGGVDARPGASNYVYDSLGRLTEAYVAGHHYTYDFTSSASASCPAGTQINAGLNTNRMRLLDQTATGTAETKYCYDAADRLLATQGATTLSSVTYDSDGNTTGLTSANGTVTTLKWDGANRNIGVKATGPDPADIAYTRDATSRIVRRDPRDCDNNIVTRYSFTGEGDTPDLTLNADGRLTSLSISLPGGVLYTGKVGTDGAFTPSFDHPSGRGDLVLTTDAAGRQVGDLRTFDPYGQPLKADGTTDADNVSDNLPGSMDYGWLGQHQRPYEHGGALSLVQMGARPYSPLLGRFLAVDPVDGGSANDYDYVVGDPINANDLDGNSWFSSVVKSVTKVAEVVSWIPGPIGAVASGVAAAGNAIQGNWGAAALYGFGAVTGGVGASVIRGAKVVGKVASAAGRGASVATKATAKFFRNGNNYLRIGKPNALSKWRVSLGPAPKHFKKLGSLGKALNPIHIHLERRKVGIDFNWWRRGFWKKW